MARYTPYRIEKPYMLCAKYNNSCRDCIFMHYKSPECAAYWDNRRAIMRGNDGKKHTANSRNFVCGHIRRPLSDFPPEVIARRLMGIRND